VTVILRAALPLALSTLTLSAQFSPPSTELPPSATTQLVRSLDASKAHLRHVWRDTPPLNDDGTVNAYIEISVGDRRKWEFDMREHTRAIDRMIPAAIGGYPVNYGFVPQTVSYDGDPFDALVLGPPLDGGRLVRGVIVGLMFMEDEKGLDSKVVLSLRGGNGQPRDRLTAADERRIGGYFRRYKEGQPGMFSRVPGWGSIADGLAYIRTTHAFFRDCRDRAGAPCRLR
jgi:inorganic pyrophosphatase